MQTWLTPVRFSLLLLAAVGLMFPSVVIGSATFVYRDFGVLGYPFLFYHHESFWRGEFPFWNPYSNCGAPFLAQWGTMALYPFSLFYLLLPIPWSVNVFCLGHLLLAGIGMFKLAKIWTSHNLAAAFAGFAFVFSGILFSCMIWPNYLVALAWMPWVVFCTEKAWSRGGPSFVIAGFVSALQLLAGVPEIAVLTWIANFALLLACSKPVAAQPGEPNSSGRAVGRLFLIVFLATGLIAVQLLPFFDLLAHSQRGAGFASSKWALPVWGLGNFLVPLFHNYENTQGIFFQSGQEFFSSTYIGITTLVLACYAALVVRHRRVWILAGLTVFCIWMALGDNGGLYAWLRGLIPALGVARYPVKFLIVPAFGLPLLAACAIAHLRSGDFGSARSGSADAPVFPSGLSAACRTRPWLWLFAVSFLGMTGIAGILWAAYRFPLPLDQWPATLSSGVERAVLLIAMVSSLALGARFSSVGRRAVFDIGVIALIVVDLLTHAPNQNPTVSSAALAPGLWESSQKLPSPKFGESRLMISPEAEQSLLMSRVRDPYKDLLGKRLALWSNLNLLDRIPKVNGSSTLQLREQMEVQSLLYQSPNRPLPKVMDFLGVALTTAPGQVLEWTPRDTFLPLITIGQKPLFANPDDTLRALADSSFDPGAAVYMPLEAQSGIHATTRVSGAVKPLRIAANQIEVLTRADSSCMVVIAQTFYQPWHAYVDGQLTTLWRANYAFQALEVPAGEHQIWLVYEDRRFAVGALISGATLMGCIAMLLAGGGRVRR